MPVVAAFALANLKGDLAAVWGWLCHRSFWQLVSMALAGYALLQHFQLADARHDRDAYKIQLEKADKAARDAEARAKAISQDVRKKHDEESRAIDRDAHSLSLSGPGKAICPRLPAAPGGSQPQGAKPNAPGSALPSDDRAAVPWGWLTQRGQEHDQLLAEVKAWHEWYDRIVKEWPRK